MKIVYSLVLTFKIENTEKNATLLVVVVFVVSFISDSVHFHSEVEIEAKVKKTKFPLCIDDFAALVCRLFVG